MPLTKEQEEKLTNDWVEMIKPGLQKSPFTIFKWFLLKINQILDESLLAQRKEIVEGIESLTRDGSEVNFEEDNEAAHINATIDTILSIPQLTGKQEEDAVPNHQG